MFSCLWLFSVVLVLFFLYCEVEIWDLEVRQHPFTLLFTSVIKHGNNLLYLAVQTLAIKTEIKDPLQVNLVAFPAKSWCFCSEHIQWTVQWRVGKEWSWWGLIIPGLDFFCIETLRQGAWEVQNKDLRWGRGKGNEINWGVEEWPFCQESREFKKEVPRVSGELDKRLEQNEELGAVGEQDNDEGQCLEV